MYNDSLIKIVLNEAEWNPCYEEEVRIDNILRPGDAEIIVDEPTANRWRYVMAEFDIVQREMEEAYFRATNEEAPFRATTEMAQ